MNLILTRKWRHMLSWITLVIGLALFVFALYKNQYGILLISGACVFASILSLLN